MKIGVEHCLDGFEDYDREQFHENLSYLNKIVSTHIDVIRKGDEVFTNGKDDMGSYLYIVKSICYFEELIMIYLNDVRDEE